MSKNPLRTFEEGVNYIGSKAYYYDENSKKAKGIIIEDDTKTVTLKGIEDGTDIRKVLKRDIFKIVGDGLKEATNSAKATRLKIAEIEETLSLPFVVSTKSRLFLLNNKVCDETDIETAAKIIWEESIPVCTPKGHPRVQISRDYNLILYFSDDGLTLRKIERNQEATPLRKISPFFTLNGKLVRISRHAYERLVRRGVIVSTIEGVKDFIDRSIKSCIDMTEASKKAVGEKSQGYRFLVSEEANSVFVFNDGLSTLVTYYPFRNSVFDTKEQEYQEAA